MTTKRGFFTRQAARAEHKAKAKQFVDGKWWYAPRVAGRYVGASPPTLTNWETNCPWLDGQGIEQRQLPGGYGRVITYYLKDDLDRVLKAKAGRALIPKIDGYVYIADAADELGVSLRTLRRIMKVKKAKTKKFGAKSHDGRPLPSAYVPRPFVDDVKNEKAKDPKPDGLITRKEAARILGIKEGALVQLIHRGILKTCEGKATCNGGYHREAGLLSGAEVEREKTRRDSRSSLLSGTNGNSPRITVRQAASATRCGVQISPRALPRLK